MADMIFWCVFPCETASRGSMTVLVTFSKLLSHTVKPSWMPSVFMSYTVCLRWRDCVCGFSSLVYCVSFRFTTSLLFSEQGQKRDWLLAEAFPNKKSACIEGKTAKADSLCIDFSSGWSSITDACFDSFENSNQCGAMITFPEMTKKRLLIKVLSG